MDNKDTAVKPAGIYKCRVADNKGLGRLVLDTVLADMSDNRTREDSTSPDSTVVNNTGGCKTFFPRGYFKFWRSASWVLSKFLCLLICCYGNNTKFYGHCDVNCPKSITKCSDGPCFSKYFYCILIFATYGGTTAWNNNKRLNCRYISVGDGDGHGATWHRGRRHAGLHCGYTTGWWTRAARWTARHIVFGCVIKLLLKKFWWTVF